MQRWTGLKFYEHTTSTRPNLIQDKFNLMIISILSVAIASSKIAKCLMVLILQLTSF